MSVASRLVGGIALLGVLVSSGVALAARSKASTSKEKVEFSSSKDYLVEGEILGTDITSLTKLEAEAIEGLTSSSSISSAAVEHAGGTKWVVKLTMKGTGGSVSLPMLMQLTPARAARITSITLV